MIKRIRFAVPAPGLGRDEFHARWAGEHVRTVTEHAVGGGHLRRYQQHRRTARDSDARPLVPYEGVEVEWYDSWEGLLETEAGAEPGAVTGTDGDLVDPKRSLVLVTEPEHVVIAGPSPRPAGLTALACPVRRRPGMDVEEFHRYWRDVHGPLNADTPAVRRYFVRYEQNHRAPADYERRPDVDFDGCTIEWFRQARDFFAMVSDPDTRDLIAADEARFLDPEGLVWILTDGGDVVFDRR